MCARLCVYNGDDRQPAFSPRMPFSSSLRFSFIIYACNIKKNYEFDWKCFNLLPSPLLPTPPLDPGTLRSTQTHTLCSFVNDKKSLHAYLIFRGKRIMLENELCFPRSASPRKNKSDDCGISQLCHGAACIALSGKITKVNRFTETNSWERVSKPRSWPRLNTIKRAPKATVSHQVTYLKVNSQSQKIFLFTTRTRLLFASFDR